MKGERNFEHYTRSVPNKERKEFDPTSRKPAGEKSFGMIPNKIVNKLLDKSNSNVRGEASEMLQIEIERSVKIREIIPFLKSFLGFLSGLMEDINSRVVINILDTILVLQKRLPTNMSGQMNLLIKMLLEINSDGKKEIKISVYQNVKQLMSNSPTQAVVGELCEVAATETDGRVRSEAVTLLSLGLLTFPRTALDLATISQTAGRALTDRRRRVRQAGLECLALAAQCLGHHQARHRLTDFLAGLDRRARSHGQMVAAVRARLARKCLPRLTTEGLLDYGPAVPGPDLDWILAGSGPLSLHSAGGRQARTPSLPPLASRRDLGSVGRIRSTRQRFSQSVSFYFYH